MPKVKKSATWDGEQNILKVLIKYSVLCIREYTFKEKQTTKKHTEWLSSSLLNRDI